jgi:3-phenylpropionate/trans-cinnamate dioxygenase ferredoxin component
MSSPQRACGLSDLRDGEPHRIVVDGAPLCLALVEGEVFAIEDRCSHANVPLSDGLLEGHFIECALHGSRFDLRTGVPATFPANIPVPTYPVTLDGEDVLVTIDRKVAK